MSVEVTPVLLRLNKNNANPKLCARKDVRQITLGALVWTRNGRRGRGRHGGLSLFEFRLQPKAIVAAQTFDEIVVRRSEGGNRQLYCL